MHPPDFLKSHIKYYNTPSAAVYITYITNMKLSNMMYLKKLFKTNKEFNYVYLKKDRHSDGL